jgi:hypothetical protein
MRRNGREQKMAISTVRRRDASNDPQLHTTIPALVSFALAVGVLARAKWGPLLEAAAFGAVSEIPVARAAAVYAAVSGAHAYVLLTLNRLLIRTHDYRGTNRPVLVAVGLLLLDVAADFYLAISRAPGFEVYSTPLGLQTVVLSYPQLAYFAWAVAFIALGYSLLRFPHNMYGLLRPYAQSLIAAGAALAAPPMASFWPWPAAVGHVLLGLVLYRAAARPAAAHSPVIRHSA